MTTSCMPSPSSNWRLLAALCSALFAARAQAAELRLHAPSGCADAAGVEEQVQRLIGRPLAEVEAIDFEVNIERAIGDRWRVVVRTLPRAGAAADGPRERRIEGASCAEVANAAAVAVAMAALERERRSPAPAPAPATSGEEPARERVTPAEPAGADAAQPRSWRAGVAVGGALDVGALPDPAPGAQLELFVGYAALRAVVLGTLFAAQQTRVPGDRGGEFQLVLGGLLLCAEPTFGRLFALACAGAELGELTGTGIDVMDPRERGVGWRALRAEAGAGWALGQGLSLVARAGVSAPLSRRQFVLDRTERVHRPGSLTARVWLGIELELVP